MIIEEIKLKNLIKESIKELLAEERLNLLDMLIPKVSKKEMAEIDKLYNSPTDYDKKDFVDKTEWFMK